MKKVSKTAEGLDIAGAFGLSYTQRFTVLLCSGTAENQKNWRQTVKKLKNKVLKRRRSRLARAVRGGGSVLASLTAGIDEAKRLGLDPWEALTVAVRPAKGGKRW